MAVTNSDIIKKQMVEALKKSLGIVSTACEACDISRQTHYRWLSEDEEYKSQVEDITESAIDFVESKLYEKIEGITIQTINAKGLPVIYEQAPSDTAIIFYLKTKAKKRGYIEKQEIDQKTEHSGSIAISWEEPPVHNSHDQSSNGELQGLQSGIPDNS